MKEDIIQLFTTIFMLYSFNFFLNNRKIIRNPLPIILAVLISILEHVHGTSRYEELYIMLGMIAIFYLNIKRIPQDGDAIYLYALVSGLWVYLLTKITIILTQLVMIILHEMSALFRITSNEFAWKMTIFSIVMVYMVGGLFVFLTNEFVKKFLVRQEINIKKYYFIYAVLMVMTIVVYLIDEIAIISHIRIRYIWIVLLIFLVAIITLILSMDTYVNAKIEEQKNAYDQQNRKTLDLYLIHLENIYHELSLNNQELSKNIKIGSNELKPFKYINNYFIRGLIFSKYLEARNQNIVFKLKLSEKILNADKKYDEEYLALETLLNNAVKSATVTTKPKIVVVISSNIISDNYQIVNTINARNCRIDLGAINEITVANKNFEIDMKSENNKFMVNLTVKKNKF